MPTSIDIRGLETQASDWAVSCRHIANHQEPQPRVLTQEEWTVLANGLDEFATAFRVLFHMMVVPLGECPSRPSESVWEKAPF